MNANSVMDEFDVLVCMLPSFTKSEVDDVRRFSDNGEWQLALDLLIVIAIKHNRCLSEKAIAKIRYLAPLVELKDTGRIFALPVESTEK
jgi:hypothetical protein